MRAVVVALVVLTPAIASADDHVGFAADASIGWGMSEDTVGHGGGHSRAGIGAQRGRFALLAEGEVLQLDTADDTLDAGWLYSSGAGAALRVELSRHAGRYVHAEVGYLWRSMHGDGEVRRGCSTFGPCDAGFYMEEPHYHDSAPYLVISLGGRSHHRTWIGGGLEAGATIITIDRSGVAPDARGAFVWFGASGTIGSD